MRESAWYLQMPLRGGNVQNKLPQEYGQLLEQSLPPRRGALRRMRVICCVRQGYCCVRETEYEFIGQAWKPKPHQH
uniref:Uncharacterized protein n=1 Tax=Trichuris muris TaxID=70415 RepID=A0A5S6Q9Z8_TRIMR